MLLSGMRNLYAMQNDNYGGHRYLMLNRCGTSLSSASLNGKRIETFNKDDRYRYKCNSRLPWSVWTFTNTIHTTMSIGIVCTRKYIKRKKMKIFVTYTDNIPPYDDVILYWHILFNTFTFALCESALVC